ncbi:MAG: T9SS type A sorting domain-containing protein [Bacteroidia bacterium]|nr:T9SS type A sorting domain-containing protein [Bacteroidia bacterium]
MMKRYLILMIAALTGITDSYSQSCFEITRILVDACGPVEGENEMVTFQVGPNALNTSNMNVQWPNNNWLGLCQDAGTAAKVAAFNSSIQGCGHLLEPQGGTLPANAKVLLITSTAVSTTANSFANLNDTVFVLFQCAGNTAGHFANYNVVPGLRTTIITFSTPAGCSDTVTYDRTQLINQFGYFGGVNYENDGAFAAFAPDGTPTYLNYGCQAPVSNFNVNAGKDTTFCFGSPIQLQGVAAGTTTLQWTGGTGIIASPTSPVTGYNPGPGETGNVLFTLTANGNCALSQTDSVLIYIGAQIPAPVIQNNNPVLISSVNNPLYFYQWTVNGVLISGANNPQYTITAAGCYGITVTDTMGCSVESDTICVTPLGINELLHSGAVMLANSPGKNPQLIFLKELTDARMEVIDMAGRLIYSRQLKNERTVGLNEQLATGIYSLRLTTRNQSGMLRFAVTE